MLTYPRTELQQLKDECSMLNVKCQTGGIRKSGGNGQPDSGTALSTREEELLRILNPKIRELKRRIGV